MVVFSISFENPINRESKVSRPSPSKEKYDHREAVITAALNTQEGRISLAQAMAEPIIRAMDYQSIGRRLLMVDELPQGALARYERDVVATVRTLNEREALVPMFEMVSNPSISLRDIKARRFRVVDRILYTDFGFDNINRFDFKFYN